MKKKFLLMKESKINLNKVVTKEIKKEDVFNLLSNKKKKIKVKIHILWEDMKKGVTQGKKNIYIYDKSQI